MLRYCEHTGTGTKATDHAWVFRSGTGQTGRGGHLCMRENGANCPFGVFPLFYRISSSLADLTTENWNHLCFWRFSPSFIVFLASKLDISHLNVVFSECRKGHLEGPQRTNGEFGLQNPETAKMPMKQGNPTRSHLASQQVLASNWPKMTTKQGRTPKGQMVPFSRGHL